MIAAVKRRTSSPSAISCLYLASVPQHPPKMSARRPSHVKHGLGQSRQQAKPAWEPAEMNRRTGCRRCCRRLGLERSSLWVTVDSASDWWVDGWTWWSWRSFPTFVMWWRDDDGDTGCHGAACLTRTRCAPALLSRVTGRGKSGGFCEVKHQAAVGGHFIIRHLLREDAQRWALPALLFPPLNQPKALCSWWQLTTLLTSLPDGNFVTNPMPPPLPPLKA